MEWPKNGPGVARGPQFSIAKYTVCLAILNCGPRATPDPFFKYGAYVILDHSIGRQLLHSSKRRELIVNQFGQST